MLPVVATRASDPGGSELLSNCKAMLLVGLDGWEQFCGPARAAHRTDPIPPEDTLKEHTLQHDISIHRAWELLRCRDCSVGWRVRRFRVGSRHDSGRRRSPVRFLQVGR